MATISEQYLANLIADAAYVEFDPNNLPQDRQLLIQALVSSGRFTDQAAGDFADKFKVVAFYSEGSSTGFQGVVFQELPLGAEEAPGFARMPGRLWIGFRGTEFTLSGSSVVNDALQGAFIFFKGRAADQIASLDRFFDLLQAPTSEGGLGILQPGVKANFAGHSLGGHLVQYAARAHQPYLNHGYTFNTANIGGPLAALLQLLGLPSWPVAGDSQITNAFGIPGPTIIGSFASGIRAGTDIDVFSEVRNSPSGALEQHCGRQREDGDGGCQCAGEQWIARTPFRARRRSRTGIYSEFQGHDRTQPSGHSSRPGALSVGRGHAVDGGDYGGPANGSGVSAIARSASDGRSGDGKMKNSERRFRCSG